MPIRIAFRTVPGEIVTCFQPETGDDPTFEPPCNARITREEIIDTTFSRSPPRKLREASVSVTVGICKLFTRDLRWINPSLSPTTLSHFPSLPQLAHSDSH